MNISFDVDLMGMIILKLGPKCFSGIVTTQEKTLATSALSLQNN
jgi:hypothetical protein